MERQEVIEKEEALAAAKEAALLKETNKNFAQWALGEQQTLASMCVVSVASLFNF